MDIETGMENLTSVSDDRYGLLPAFKEILSWSRLHGDARLAASRQA